MVVVLSTGFIIGISMRTDNAILPGLVPTIVLPDSISSKFGEKKGQPNLDKFFKKDTMNDSKVDKPDNNIKKAKKYARVALNWMVDSVIHSVKRLVKAANANSPQWNYNRVGGDIKTDTTISWTFHRSEHQGTTMQPLAAIIAANRSFLIEQINTMALVRAFQDQGITFFDGLDGTLGRQQRAERFLTILEEKNLVDQLWDILREQGMTYVMDRLNNCRKAYSADPHILERNISNKRTNIHDDLDIDDIREIFNEREVFSSSMFDEIEEKYSGSENQMYAVLTKIKESGSYAMRTLVDVLYINQLDSLADSLLIGTSNKLQKWMKTTHKQRNHHQVPEDNAVSVPSK